MSSQTWYMYCYLTPGVIDSSSFCFLGAFILARVLDSRIEIQWDDSSAAGLKPGSARRKEEMGKGKGWLSEWEGG